MRNPSPSFSLITRESSRKSYRGRLAPSPTGLLHIGHARTFWIAARRAIENQGTLILRNEDLDPQRSRAEFARAMIEDLLWLGIRWSEGPDCGGAYGPYSQSERRAHYLEAWRRLRDGGFLYPCICSRKDLAQAASAPNDVETDDEPVYQGTCRDRKDAAEFTEPVRANWRFRVPEGEVVEFDDLNLGRQRFVAGNNFDFGDFLVWRRDDVPAYQLAVVVDDVASCQVSVGLRMESSLSAGNSGCPGNPNCRTPLTWTMGCGATPCGYPLM